jgi:hypothetical protein
MNGVRLSPGIIGTVFLNLGYQPVLYSLEILKSQVEQLNKLNELQVFPPAHLFAPLPRAASPPEIHP